MQSARQVSVEHDPETMQVAVEPAFVRRAARIASTSSASASVPSSSRTLAMRFTAATWSSGKPASSVVSSSSVVARRARSSNDSAAIWALVEFTAEQARS